jgi:hypothetical protein
MMQCMRTTLTLDPDVAARLKRLRRRRDARFKDIVNSALREGLRRMEEKPHRRRKSWTKPVPLGGSRIGSLDNIAEVLAVAQLEAFKSL